MPTVSALVALGSQLTGPPPAFAQQSLSHPYTLFSSYQTISLWFPSSLFWVLSQTYSLWPSITTVRWYFSGILLYLHNPLRNTIQSVSCWLSNVQAWHLLWAPFYIHPSTYHGLNQILNYAQNLFFQNFSPSQQVSFPLFCWSGPKFWSHRWFHSFSRSPHSISQPLPSHNILKIFIKRLPYIWYCSGSCRYRRE